MFPGQYHDQETGLHYNYFRYYDPSTGRYLSSDPVGLVGGTNTYAYVSGNPMRYFDFYGLAKECVLTWVKLQDTWRQTPLRRPRFIRGGYDPVFSVNPKPNVYGELPPIRRGRIGMPLGLGHDIRGTLRDNREFGYDYWWEKWAELGYYEEVCVDECGNWTTDSGLPGNRPIDNPIGEWRFDPTSDTFGP